MIGNIGTNIADILLDTTKIDSGSTIPMDEISSIFSLAVNLLSTILIAFKAWNHRQALKIISVNKRKHTQVEKILLFLVESGVVYCVIQCLYVIIQIFATKLGSSIGLEIWDIGIGEVADATAVLYPLAVFLALSLDQSPVEAFLSTIHETHNGDFESG
ncbi:hypothetical protein BT96DRAFT_552563 [Gymnopus androsaceus JB14]|uniref:Uncharacterized protein n=1 Tax=Gymnopus androsaceus JB14 TaxID=1447944 RepID=A0A6A4HV87_9AGAR|nr:hypothetical protein BT96DRAFT_552563 [Gymnopus androsaceus JB14]